MRRLATAVLTFSFLGALTAGSLPGMAAVSVAGLALAAAGARSIRWRDGDLPPGVRYLSSRREPDNIVPFERFRTVRAAPAARRGDEQAGEKASFRTPPAA